MLKQEIMKMARVMMMTYVHMGIHPLRTALHQVQAWMWMLGGKCPAYSRQEIADMTRLLDAVYGVQDAVFDKIEGGDPEFKEAFRHGMTSVRPALDKVLQDCLRERWTFSEYIEGLVTEVTKAQDISVYGEFAPFKDLRSVLN
jgi:hypothetical protein